MKSTSKPLVNEVVQILRSDPNRMFSKEEILNLLSHLKRDRELEQILAELEVASAGHGNPAAVNAKCRGGTVYYNWNG